MSKGQVAALLQKVRRWIEEEGLFPQTGRIIAALSGGADSLAMTAMLASLFPKERILCAHVNHGIRGEEAQADEAFVAQWCREQGLALEVLHADVPGEARRSGEGLEACGRRVRYAFLEKLAPGENDRIATAHTRSDQAETVLLHLLQGAGLRGLSGIRPVRGKVVRPVLCLSRQETEAFCREKGLLFRTDSTNSSVEYTRNRLRLEVLPLLRELNPNIEETLVRTARGFRRDDDCLDALARQALEKARPQGDGEERSPFLKTAPLQSLPDGLALRAMELYFRERGCPRPETVHLETALGFLKAGGGRMHFPGGWELSVWTDRLCLAQIPESSGGWEVPVSLPETRLGDGRRLFLEVFPVSEMKNRINFHNLLFPILFDYDTISRSQAFWAVRTRRPGDRFVPAGRGVAKSLKKLLNEARVPPSQRERLAMLTAGEEILWLEGFGVCQRCRPGPQTRQVLLLRLEDGAGKEKD